MNAMQELLQGFDGEKLPEEVSLFQARSTLRKPIAQHNAEMDAHSRKYFPPDPGRRPRIFRRDSTRGVWIACDDGAYVPRPGFLNYHGKSEVVGGLTIERRDMTDAEFAALPREEAA